MIPAGSINLEAQLRQSQGLPRGAAVVCHPHPLYGGTMDNRVVYRAAKAIAEAGWAALRFNFRGVGGSGGQYDQGMGEKQDVAAALDWIENQYPGFPLGLIGYSFGAWVGLPVACSSPRVRIMAGIGLPLNLFSLDCLTACPKPALYIVGTRDEFCSMENLHKLAARLPSTAIVHRIPGADHFFTNHIDIVQNLIFNFFKNLQFDTIVE
jgi:alpha/beta superfamily hydrolase